MKRFLLIFYRHRGFSWNSNSTCSYFKKPYTLCLSRKNGERLYEEEGWNNADAEEDEAEAEEVQLDMKTVYEFATESPIEEISFILKARDMNKKAAELALAHDYGHLVRGDD